MPDSTSAVPAPKNRKARSAQEIEYLGTEDNFLREEIVAGKGLEEKYGRKVVHEEFGDEVDYELSPFQKVFLYRGTGDGLAPRKHIGSWKGVIRVVYEESVDTQAEELADLTKFIAPIDCQIRLYVLKGSDLVGMDSNNLSDPYLKVSLGNKSINMRKHYISATTKPDFHQYFEFNTSLPGVSSLVVSVFPQLILVAEISCSKKHWSGRGSSIDALFEMRISGGAAGHPALVQENRWTHSSAVPDCF